jgi:hypothetical protein
MPNPRHHVVPRFYLARFADERGRIAVFPIDGSPAFLASIDNAAVEAGFYTIDSDDGPANDAEVLLGSIETVTSEALRKIDQGEWPLGAEGRTALANFLPLQLVRGWNFRQSFNQSTEDTVRAISRMLGDHPDYLRQRWRESEGIEPTEEELSDLARFMREDDEYIVVPSQNAAILTALQVASNFVEPVNQMRWDLLQAGGGEFITGDHPVGMWSSKADLPGVGLYTAEEVTFPLNRKQCLALRWARGAEGHWECTEREVQLINVQSCIWAHRFAFSHPSVLEAGGLTSVLPSTPAGDS